MKNRLSKILAACGVASRRGAETLIFDGDVRVNGHICTTPQTMVEVGKDKIQVKGKTVRPPQSKVAYMLNKPKGYICSNKRLKESEKLVIDLFPKETRRLFTVGRLDKETSGLLVVTNDGQLAQELIHPSKQIPKEYIVKTTQPIEDEHVISIRKGKRIEGKFLKPLKALIVNRFTVKVIVAEGKKHEVRQFVEKTGLKITSLKRTRIGSLLMDKLPLGCFRQLTSKDLQKMLK